MPDTTLTTLVVATGGAFLGKFVGPAAEHYGKQALERVQQLGAQATTYLAAVGREPQPVEPKLLLPLVQAASLETDETLAEKWAALLANAADPAQKIQVQPGFGEVLRQLTPMDARILQMLYYHSGHAIEPVGNRLMRKEVMKSLGLTYDEATFYSENLLRLGLCANAAASVADISNSIHDGVGMVATTAFGLAFMRAVTPPTL